MKITRRQLRELINEAASPRIYTTGAEEQYFWQPFIQSAKYWQSYGGSGSGATGKEMFRPEVWLQNLAVRKTGNSMEEGTVGKFIQIALIHQPLKDTVQDLQDEWTMWHNSQPIEFRF